MDQAAAIAREFSGHATRRHRPRFDVDVTQNCLFLFVQLFSRFMKGSTKAKEKTKNVPFDPILFAATVPARKPTAKDLKDAKEHENDPIEPKGHDTMDDALEDL